MKSLIAKRYLIRQNLVAIIGMCLGLYFCYHLMAGERSYWRLSALESKIESVDQNLSMLQENRAALEEKVVMMRPGSINRDLLEERVRVVLGYRAPTEKIIIQN